MKLSTFIFITSFLDGLDDLSKVLATVAFFGAIIAFVMFVIWRGAKASGSQRDVDEIEPWIKFMRIQYWLPAFLFFSILASAIPPKTEMYAMYGAEMVTKLAEDADLQQAGKDTQEIVHSLSVILKGAADEIEKPNQQKK
jgi:hypothetical protein